jgi:hypothetical protein
MSRIFVTLCFAALAGCAHGRSDLIVNEQKSPGRGLLVAVESTPDFPGDKATSTTFEAIRAPNDSTRLTDEDWDIPAGVYVCIVEIGHERQFAKRVLLFTSRR